jgi:hypothetical protein
VLVAILLLVIAAVAIGGYFVWRERAHRYAGLTAEQARVQAAAFLHNASPETRLVLVGAAHGFDGITGKNAWEVRFDREPAGAFVPVSPDCVVYVRTRVSHFASHNACVHG